MGIIPGLAHALQLAFFMLWEVFWPLALGFLLSAVVQTLVSTKTVSGLLGTDSPRGVLLATAFGAASSSCSYAAVAVARTIFRKGGSFSNAMIFEFASTNLVFELGLVLLILLGWQFLAAEVVGGIVMIVILSLLFRLTLSPALVAQARQQAEKGIAGRMEGHGDMDMSVTDGPLLRRLVSRRVWTSISHYFYMDLASLYVDLGLGFLIAGALTAWVPETFWQRFFFSDNPVFAAIWGPLVGPLISMISFVCSVGNVPLAAVLWNGGISFGGVVSFIFADLIIIPILTIYRKYYGGRVSMYLFVVSYVAMVLAGYTVELTFSALGVAPAHRAIFVMESRPEWNVTTALDILFLALMAVLGWRFLTTGGPGMLRAMSMQGDHTAHAFVTDPVCGMSIDPRTATEHAAYRGVGYTFCSVDCRSRFERDPEQFVHEHDKRKQPVEHPSEGGHMHH